MKGRLSSGFPDVASPIFDSSSPIPITQTDGDTASAGSSVDSAHLLHSLKNMPPSRDRDAGHPLCAPDAAGPSLSLRWCQGSRPSLQTVESGTTMLLIPPLIFHPGLGRGCCMATKTCRDIPITCLFGDKGGAKGHAEPTSKVVTHMQVTPPISGGVLPAVAWGRQVESNQA
jgi:hypothetical protein